MKPKLKPIQAVARKAGLPLAFLEPYGRGKAKIDWRVLKRLKGRKDGKLILVSSMNPTRFGEGKTVTTIGLAQALARLGKKALICLRQPSMGPVFGVKGGATGGGKSKVEPAEDINLMFTGDIAAVSAAANLLAALIDNHLARGNKLGLDPDRIAWPRALDVNDRALRDITVCQGTNVCVEHESHFVISAASEVMACLCLANDLTELKEMLGSIVVGYSRKGGTVRAVRARQLKAAGAMAAILRDALKPNLVQSTEGIPAFVHGGPFANIAHGTNSVLATRLALKLAHGGHVVTEAGFGSDLGLEKFMDIVSRKAGYKPDCVVLVASLKALKHHGGAREPEKRNQAALEQGFANLEKHVENAALFGLPCVVAINRFPLDSAQETEWVRGKCAALGVEAVPSRVFAEGGRGGEELARAVLKAVQRPGQRPGRAHALYSLQWPLKKKIEAIATHVYGAGRVTFSAEARRDLKRLEALGFGRLPVCVSKTQYSLSDDPEKRGRPRGFSLRVRGAQVSAGAGFVVVYVGDLISLPGLPEKPAAERMDVDEKGEVTGLF